jgi:hypothetical protein
LIIAQHPKRYSFETLSVVLFRNRPLQNDGRIEMREGCGECRWSSASNTEREFTGSILGQSWRNDLVRIPPRSRKRIRGVRK